MSSYRRHYLPSISWSDVKGGVRLIQPYSVTDYFLIFRVQNLLTSAVGMNQAEKSWKLPTEKEEVHCSRYESGRKEREITHREGESTNK